MAAYRRVYDSRHLHADCQEPGSATEPYTLGNRVWATFTYLLPVCRNVSLCPFLRILKSMSILLYHIMVEVKPEIPSRPISFKNIYFCSTN